MPSIASGEFSIDLKPGEPDFTGTGRFDFTKVWTGAIAGRSEGFMASAGDPASGNAGYVAIEVFTGSVDGAEGAFVFQQFGLVKGGEQELRYEIVPGSGSGALAGITGTLDLNREDGQHLVALTYEL
ncbi:MAG: DUF3224 domain-containing protein [Solirubrobacterales bacterium]